MLRLTASFLLFGLVVKLPSPSHAHGRLWDPPARSSMWRRGYNTPINKLDNELFCGGFFHQIAQGYKCGVCGDPYDGARHNEAGGKYATGLITREYFAGSVANIEVDLTANHKGWMEFRLCPVNDLSVKATKECLDKNLLQLADGSGTRFKITTEMGSKIFTIPVKLPADLTCDQCVLQWRYHAGNSWGVDPDGSECTGCGLQEEFYGCADIRITKRTEGHQGGQILPTIPSVTGESGGGDNSGDGSWGGGSSGGGAGSSGSSGSGAGSSGSNGSGAGSSGSSGSGAGSSDGSGVGSSGSGSGVSVDKMVCESVVGSPDMDNWCQLNCPAGNCPQSTCLCKTGSEAISEQKPGACKATGGYASIPGYDKWCRENCAGGYCPPTICEC